MLFNLTAADFEASQIEVSQNSLKSLQKAIEKRHGENYVILGKPGITSVYDENGSALSAFRTEKYNTEAANASNHLYTEQHMSNFVGNKTLSERVEVQINKKKFSASCTQIFLESYASQVGIPLACDGEQVNWNENHCNDQPVLVYAECDFYTAAAAWQAGTPYIIKPMWRLCTSPLCASKQLAEM